MKIISWNVKGLNASDKRQRIKQVIDSLQEDIILLQETKLNEKILIKSLHLGKNGKLIICKAWVHLAV